MTKKSYFKIKDVYFKGKLIDIYDNMMYKFI